jgi:predicted GIY-YIG superfamily endonuclease
MFCVYGLIDPRTQELRYIGYSSDYLERYKEHLFRSNLKLKTHKNNWINSLLNLNLKPELIVLEEASSEADGLQKESDLIAYYKYIGCDLTNGTLGGDGRYGFITTAEVKLKISQSMKGKNTKSRIVAACLFCGKDFEFLAKYKKRGHKYCSLICANRNRKY